MYTAIYRWQRKQTSDEFYTRREDIEDMLPEWDLSDKIVYCCADSDESEFVKYFKQPGKCKELIYTSDDFRTHQDLFEKCDVVVTNPPFSLIRALIRMLSAIKRDFILIQPVIPSVAVPDSNYPCTRDVFFFKRLTKFRNTEKTSLCQWVSTLGTKEHPYGYSYKELFGKDYKICENWEEAPVVNDYNGVPVRKYGKRTGFPPKDFDGWFVVTPDNNCSDFSILGSADKKQKGFRYLPVFGNYAKWKH